MRGEAEAYYAELGREYPTRIRQLVPHYDDMVGTLVDLLEASLDERPHLLDLGVGEGTLARRVLDRLPAVRLTAVDGSESMLDRARERLADHRARATLVHADLDGELPGDSFTAAWSSLALHNLRPDAKRDLLRRVRERLEPGGIFVWADLVRHADPALQDHLTRRRVEAARDAGCPEDFLAWNFEKEETEDFPLTVEGALQLGRASGFGRASPVWLRGMFAVVLLRR